MPLRPHQSFNLIVASAALALLAEGALLWKLSDRAPEIAPAAPTPAAPTPAANQSAPATTAPRAAPPLFVAPGVTPQGVAPPEFAAPNGANSPFSSPQNAPKSVAPGQQLSGQQSTKQKLPGQKALSAAQAGLAKTYFEAATAALGRKDSKSALENFRRVAQIAPNHLPTRLNLALLYLQLNQPAQAVPHLQKAAALDPKNPAPRFQLAQAYLALDQPALALAPLQETVRIAPEERRARALLAQVYGAQKRPRDAYKQWSALAQSETRDVESHLQAASLAALLKLPNEAEKWLRRAQTGSPKDARPALGLAQLLRAQNQPARAATILAAAAKTSPAIFEIYPALADARLASGDLGGARGALQTALQRLPQGQNAEQKARIARAEGELHLSLGRVLGQSKQPKAARAEFARAAQLLPREADPQGLLALAELQSGDKKAAQLALKRAIALDPKRAADRLTLAQLLAQNGDFRGAQEQFALYAATQPRDLDALSQWAQVELRLKEPDKAVQIYGKIAALAPKNPLPLVQSGEILRDRKRLAPALANFERALALRPGDAGALFEVARLQSALKRPAASATWQKFIALKPDFLPAYPAMLAASARSGTETGARLFLARQLARGAENPRVLSEVLRFYAQTGGNSQAKALLADIVKRNPKAKTARAALDSFGTARAVPTLPPTPVGAAEVPKAETDKTP